MKIFEKSAIFRFSHRLLCRYERTSIVSSHFRRVECDIVIALSAFCKPLEIVFARYAKQSPRIEFSEDF